MTMDVEKIYKKNLINNVEFLISDTPVGYLEAIRFMDDRVKDIHSKNAPELVWLLEHPSIYTAGTSARDEELLDKSRFPIYKSGRGGHYTYHGPGQRIAYVMLDLSKRGNDIRKFVHSLEKWVIKTLGYFNVIGEVHKERIGIWTKSGAVDNPLFSEEKIASIGVRVRHGITFHGVAINIDPNLEHFSGIIPCGIESHGITSLWNIGLTTTMAELDSVLINTFNDIFNEPCKTFNT